MNQNRARKNSERKIKYNKFPRPPEIEYNLQMPPDSAPAPLPSLLIVDDDPVIQDLLGECLADTFAVVGAQNRQDAVSALAQMPAPPDFALVDLGLPPAPHRPDEGFAVVQKIQAAAPACATVVVSGQQARRHAERARAIGAGDFVEKPCSPETLRDKLLAVRRALDAARRAMGLVGESPPIRKLREQIQLVAQTALPVLIQGESGSGKEVAARALHSVSRPDRPFLAAHCAALPPHLAEPTLFGHVKGAFTGAAAPSAGFFGDAEDGFLFLDEIGDLSAEMQPKLLRALESGEYRRVGETRIRRSAARVVAASNRNLARDAHNGKFRQDLYHRISVFTLTVPPLRQMDDDRFLLLDHFGKNIADDLRAEPFVLSPRARDLWREYQFPGNVRELRNIVARLQVKFAGRKVQTDDLRAELCALPETDKLRHLAESMLESGELPAPLPETLNQLRRDLADAAISRANGDEKAAAKILGVSPRELRNISPARLSPPAPPAQKRGE